MNNRICSLLKIKYPIIQGGMVWCSGWKLASAVSNAGGLGLIGSGSMNSELLREHIVKCKKATKKPFGVNIPLMYPEIERHINVILEQGVQILFTSAGNPKTWTEILKSEGIKVVHVVSSSKFAIKSQDAGVDAVVAEGFEAGGHNGIEETTTLCLVPEIIEKVDIPVIAAGGISTGRSMFAIMALGAEGVQMGTRFAASIESSAHQNFKDRILHVHEGDTSLSIKKLVPVRLIRNEFYHRIQTAEDSGAGRSELIQILGKGRARRGMFEGDLIEGELEIGQVASLINQIKPAAKIVKEIWDEFLKTKNLLLES
jgi:enoyl-[acyl-carrier protein] reductase II